VRLKRASRGPESAGWRIRYSFTVRLFHSPHLASYPALSQRPEVAPKGYLSHADSAEKTWQARRKAQKSGVILVSSTQDRRNLTHSRASHFRVHFVFFSPWGVCQQNHVSSPDPRQLFRYEQPDPLVDSADRHGEWDGKVCDPIVSISAPG
jgi:hypothetical protein